MEAAESNPTNAARPKTAAARPAASGETAAGERDLRKALTVATCVAVVLGVASIRLLVGGDSPTGVPAPAPTPPAALEPPRLTPPPEVLLPQVLLPARPTTPGGRTAYRPVVPEAPPQPLR